MQTPTEQLFADSICSYTKIHFYIQSQEQFPFSLLQSTLLVTAAAENSGEGSEGHYGKEARTLMCSHFPPPTLKGFLQSSLLVTAAAGNNKSSWSIPYPIARVCFFLQSFSLSQWLAGCWKWLEMLGRRKDAGKLMHS